MGRETLIKGSFLWDGVQEKLISDCILIIEDKTIKSVNKLSEISIGTISHDRIFDFSGMTLLPGLIDCHTHHSMDASLEDFLDKMKDSIPELSIRAENMIKKDLSSGVTTCRTLGDKEYIDIKIRDKINNGLLEGPRSIVAGKGIRAANGHGFVGYPFKGTEEIKKAIMDNLRAGADFIKIYISGTLKGNGNLPSYLTRKEVSVAIDTSHKEGVKIASHCVGGIGLDWALDLGLDTLEHAYHINDSQIEKLLQSNTELVLTLSPIFNDKVVNNYPKNLIQGHYDEREEISRRIKNVISTGIQFTLGTDGMHGGLAHEAELAVKLGASNLQALKALTVNGAKLCGIEKEAGIIAPGKNADIIAIEGNPLQNIETLKRVKAVIKQGQILTKNNP